MRAPELPFASVFARRSIAARTISSAYGSPTPHACERSSRSCSSPVSSSGIERLTKRPKPVLTPYVCSLRAVRRALDELARGAHLLAGGVGERRGRPLDRDGPDVGDTSDRRR